MIPCKCDIKFVTLQIPYISIRASELFVKAVLIFDLCVNVSNSASCMSNSVDPAQMPHSALFAQVYL